MAIVSQCVCIECHKSFQGVSNSDGLPPNVCSSCEDKQEQVKRAAKQAETTKKLAALQNLPIEARLNKLEKALLELTDLVLLLQKQPASDRQIIF
jgi:hypothetical protein